MISVSEALELVVLSPDEQRSADQLEIAIDAELHSKFDGSPIKMEFDGVAPKVAYAIQRRFEEPRPGGSWRVSVTAAVDKVAFGFVPMIFGLPMRPRVIAPEAPSLPPVVDVKANAADGRPRLLVRMPTRGRPAQALKVLTQYRERAGAPIAIEVVVDVDDVATLAPEVLQRLNALDCSIAVGRHKSKIEAVNGGRVHDWDVLLLASDDMVPVRDGYAARILSAVEEHFPHLDGAVFFNDGHQGENCCTLPIMGRRFYEQWGYVYEPEYTSLFCDQEQTELWRAMGRLAYVDEKIVEHRHHVWGLADKDALYEKNDKYWDVDKAVYESRVARKQPHGQFRFGAPPLWLSIGIVTLPERRPQLARLLDHIWAQILARPGEAKREVEVVIDARTEVEVGDKRHALLQRAKGHFITFVDDDDWIAHDYVERVVDALKAKPEADCASLRGVMTTDGQTPEVFEHSIAHSKWYVRDGEYKRNPNHLNAVRRKLALQTGFASVSHGEDWDFSQRLYPLLKTEASTGAAPLYFYWFRNK